MIPTFYLKDSEADEHLQVKEDTAFTSVLFNFLRKEGRAIRLELGGEQKAVLFQDDVVFPSCSAGFCRSQTLWALLRKYQNKIQLFAPHATRYGLDPYNGQVNWHRSPQPINDEFLMWAYVPKATRFGFDFFADLLHQKEASFDQLQEMTHYYNKHFYGPESSSQGLRRVYMSFDKNTHAIMHRLNQTNERLKNVVIYHFPLQDHVSHPLEEWNTQPLSYKSYEEFSKILLQIIDLRHLEEC